MTSTTTEKPRAKRKLGGWRVADFKRYTPRGHREPHPSVWATETVKRDDWEVVSYRREIAVAETGGTTVHFIVEQSAQVDSEPMLVVEHDEPIRLSGEWGTLASNPLSDFDHLFTKCGRALGAFKVHWNARTIRPGVLEALSEALEVPNDDELASALDVDRVWLDLLRAGFTPFGDNPAVFSIQRALERTGIARDWSHALNLMVGY